MSMRKKATEKVSSSAIFQDNSKSQATTRRTEQWALAK